MSDKDYFYFETGFEKCWYQFEEVGLIPEDREDFPSFDKVIATLPKEVIEPTGEKTANATELE